MRWASVFTGLGMLDYGLTLAGMKHAWMCESDPWRRELLAKRWPGVLIYSDIREIGADLEPVEGIAGGFPCKGASTAGLRTGLDHPETALWAEQFRLIGLLRPRYALVENVANILALDGGRVWGRVLADLASLGFDVWWDCLPAAAVGAPHLRDRVFAVAAHPTRCGGQGTRAERKALERTQPDDSSAAADADEPRTHSHSSPGGSRPTTGERNRLAPDSRRNGVRQQPESERRSQGARELAATRGVAWGEYGPAIERWEQVAGPAPEPLLRGVDDRAARKLVRSRLSALGDGVQVQVGELVGRMILEHAHIETAQKATP